jgi:RNA polymerase sigma-B factor
MTRPNDSDGFLEMFRAYHQSRDRRLRDVLVLEHQWIAQRCARRFADRGEPLADLVQVAQIGLVKAVDRFDPTLGHAFVSFATPTVTGELRRHFRDTTWKVAVPRRLKDLLPRLNAAIETLHQRLGRPPLVEEVAQELGVEADLVIETMDANRCYRTASLDVHADDGHGAPSYERVGLADPELDGAELRLSAREAVRQLDERSQNIILWRFYEGCTQSEIGERLGVGQVQVSRLLRSALAELKSRLADVEEGAAGVPAGAGR